MLNNTKRRSIVSILLIFVVMVSLSLQSYADTTTKSTDTTDPFELTATKAKRVARVTGKTLEGETIPNPNQTATKYGLTATDLGIIWDATTDPNDKKMMVAFGDSYDEGWGGFGGGGDGKGWRSNLLAISKDADPSDGLSFSSMITDTSKPNYAKEIIHSDHITDGNSDFTAIPTAGVTAGNRHFIHYMQIKNWGANGRWNTNFSEVAYSDDEGQTWTKSGVKWGATSKFAQAAYVKEGGYIYMFGTPAGRFDNAYLARVSEADMLNKAKYEYWDGSKWVVNNEAAAVAVVDAPVSELSVSYNSYYKKWIMVYLNENRYAIVMRSSSELTGGWSAETEIATGEEYPGLYGGFIYPWKNDGKDLYFLMSEWGPYNVVLMHTTLEKGTPSPNLVADPSFEKQTSGTISAPWILEGGKGGIDKATGTSKAGSNNVYVRNDTGWNGIKQNISVSPNTEYVLSGYVKTSQNNNAGYFGVRAADGKIIKEQPFGRNDNYTKQTVRFNSGDNTSVTLFTGMWANGDTWVQADDYMLVPVDTTPPTITLKGDETIDLSLGDAFTDPGATASDSQDGDLSDKIEVAGKVDPNIIGRYSLTYNVKDSDGNAAKSVTRTVNVTGEDYTVSHVAFKGSDGSSLTKLPKKGFISASAEIRNNTSEAKEISLVVALYNKKGEVENLSGVTKALPSGSKETITGGFNMPGNNSGYHVEIFVADSLTGLKPLSNIARLEQK